MKEFVDLYAKLVIGTFTFIGPSFTLLISLFSKQVSKANAKNKERIQNLASLDGETKALKRQLNKSERDKNLLNPRRQVKRLFLTLLISLGLIELYYFQHTTFWMPPKWVKCATLGASFTLYLYCLFVLWQLFCIIISAKHEEDEETKERKIPLKPKK